MALGKLALGLLGILAYKNRDRIGALIGKMTGRRSLRKDSKNGTELPDDVPPADARRGGRSEREAMSSLVRERELSQQDSLLESTSGRDDDKGAEPGFMGSNDISQPVGATPRSAITGRHDEGMDANETVDGLGETEELTRHLAEDTPTGGSDRREEIPVFERGRTPTRI